MLSGRHDTFVLVGWLRYYVETEEYDRKLPGCWRDKDCWHPTGGGFFQSIGFAARKRDDLLDRFRELQIPVEIINSCKRYVSDLPYERQKRELAWLLEYYYAGRDPFEREPNALPPS